MNEIENKDFCHLHVHTEYSLLDGSGKIGKLISKTKELGMKSLAITDHGTMFGCVDFYKSCIEQGIKPIIGCEIYVAEKSMFIKQPDKDNSTFHLVLLVKNNTGYRNLMKIVSAASIDGFYYKPRVDHDFLQKHCEGIIALSACLGGEVQSNILKEDMNKSRAAAMFYKNTFKDGFYLELQNHGMNEQLRVNDELISMSKELHIPLVATNDVHYISKEDSKSHDILLCIQTGKTVEDEKRMRYPSNEFYLKSGEEMYEQFSYIQEALDNTVKIADECNFNYEFHISKLPKFPLPDGVDAFDYMRQLCYIGLKERYENIEDVIKTRLEYELGVIKSMGYVDYFLIVWDFIKFARESNIFVGPGRGSAAGSIVAYTLSITKIDPLKYGLIFERFLNPDRISMPDIDSDFCYERRQEVIDYVVKKYGKNNVSQIVTFGTMAARVCLRDVGRAMNYSYAEVDKLAKMIPAVLNITIDKALELNAELKKLYDNEERVKDLIDIARSLEGLPRHTSTHAAGVVIASEPLVNYVPLLKNDEAIVTQFPMNTLEELGLLKMDFLGLRTLTVMRDSLTMIKQNKGVDIDLDHLDFDDKEVYKMIGEGKTVGAFQLESAGMTSFMKELKPDKLEDIIAGISLYRPGPMAEIPRYIENKKNPDNIEYETPELEAILNVTYGCMVYQEQVMDIVRKLAGYSMGRSDLLRRAMSKKKHKVMEQERHNFIYGIVDESGNIDVPGCIRNGIKEESANRIFDSMTSFASYAFVKGHATAYAVIAFQTAYLMRYYPTEFIAAMLNSFMGSSEKVSFYIRFASQCGIQVLPPDINESFAKFTVNANSIRFGMAAIKNIGINVIDSIVLSREGKGKFTSLTDFCSKIDISSVNKRAVESMIKSGAMDSFKVFRSKMLAIFEKILEGISSQKKRNIDGQLSIFGDFGGKKDDVTDQLLDVKYPDIKEFEKKYLLAMEKEMTGLYLSGHPLDEYVQTLNVETNTKISDIIVTESLEDELLDEDEKVKDGDKVIIGGIVTELTKKITKNNEMMAFIKVQDLYASIEIVVFPRIYEKFKSLIEVDQLVIIKGRISIREEEQPKILCEQIDALVKINSEKIYLQYRDEKQVISESEKLKSILLQHPGNIPVYIYAKREKKKFRMDRQFWVNDDEKLTCILKKIIGENNVKKI